MPYPVGEGPPDYVAIGHLTIDHTPNGPQLGGTVLYAALAAARFGARAAVLTQANLALLPETLQEQLDEFSTEVELVIQGSDSVTTFTNHEMPGRRRQTLHDWAGEIDLSGLPPGWRSAPAIHVAPVAREIDPRGLHRLAPDFLAITPQGWFRRWGAFPSDVHLESAHVPSDLVARFDAAVISSDEYAIARDFYDVVGLRSLAVMTRGQQGASVLDRGRPTEVRGYPARAVDTTGAGDVFAGVLFYLRSQREPVMRSLRAASAAAALSTEKVGISGVPQRDKVENLVAVEASRP